MMKKYLHIFACSPKAYFPSLHQISSAGEDPSRLVPRDRESIAPESRKHPCTWQKPRWIETEERETRGSLLLHVFLILSIFFNSRSINKIDRVVRLSVVNQEGNMDVSALLDRAWSMTADSRSQEIKLSDVYLLIDNISNLSSTKILSNDLKKLLMTFILQNDNGMVYLNKVQFKELFFELFNVELDDLFTNGNITTNNKSNDYNDYTVHSFNQDTNYTRNILRKNTRNNEYDTPHYDYSNMSKNSLFSEINFLKRDISNTMNDHRRLNELNNRIRKAYDELILRFEREEDERQRKAKDTKKLTKKLDTLVSMQDNYLGTLNQKISSLKDPKNGIHRKKSANLRLNLEWFKTLASYPNFSLMSTHDNKYSGTGITGKLSNMFTTFKSILFLSIFVCIAFSILSLFLDFVNNFYPDNGYFDYPDGLSDSYYQERNPSPLLNKVNPINWFG